MENISIWKDLEKHLSGKFSLIKIDLPGHGKSPLFRENSFEFMAEKIKEVVDYLKIKHFHLLGHSMGGYVSLAFAEVFPERLKSLTLFFSSTLADSEEVKSIRIKSIKIIEENFETFVNILPNSFSDNEKDILEDKMNLAKEIELSTNPEAVKSAMLEMAERPDRTGVLENLDAKILIISGKYDKAVNTEEFLKHVPEKANIKTYVLDCGHNGHWEKPSICAEIINTELLLLG
jgi:pimeloyl-ACP methyl ester carboxylesterase